MPDELLVLGSASGQPTRRRFSTAYALTAAGGLFLIDCGAPVSTLLYRYDLDPTDVQAVFLSHWHMDHIAGLGLFLSQNCLLNRPSPLNIYGPRGTPAKIRRLLTDSFLSADALGFDLNIISVKKYKPIKKALIRVTYFETRHLASTRYRTQFGRKAVACGMRIDGPGWCIVYSGDLRAPEELSAHVNDCDVLIHEMTHVNPEDVADFAAMARVPRVLISHIGPEFDETPERIVEAFQGRYHGQLTVAEDGTKIQLNKTT
jgi:ribonuclease Z